VKSPVDVVRSRVTGRYEIDPWGYDRDLVELLDPLMGLRWSVSVDGAEHVPADGPFVLVANRRIGASEPLVLARGIRRATDRRVRFLGIPDVPVAGALLRRIGGAVDRPAELRTLLRAGHPVAVPLSRRLYPRRIAGSLDAEVLLPAVELGVPILPVALIGRELLPRWRIALGEPVPPPTHLGPLGLADVAERVEAGVQALLDEAFPPRWLLP
jgi:1-acyl-sn-glycerol-3-phosphate acyltransferase